MALLVAGHLAQSASDPVGETSGGKVILGEHGESIGAATVSLVLTSSNPGSTDGSRANSLEFVLEVLEGKGVLQDLGVGGTVGPLESGGGRGAKDRGEGDESRGLHCGRGVWVVMEKGGRGKQGVRVFGSPL